MTTEQKKEAVKDSWDCDDPFPPLWPENSTDTIADKVLDAAMRFFCEEKRKRLAQKPK